MSHHTVGTRAGALTRRDIDIAVGILVGLHGYSEQQAFDELVRAAYRTGAGISSVSRSLIAIAGGRNGTTPYQEQALEIWGDVVHGLRAS